MSVQSAQTTSPALDDLPGEINETELASSAVSAAPSEELGIYVHICGAVNQPGVYCLSGNARVFELVESAGGFTEDAAQWCVNMASKLSDGEQLIVPTKEQAESGEWTVGTQGKPGGGTEEPEGARIDLNTASKEQLMTLPGIGESKAEAILSYRETKGGFASIEELKNVDGIKDGTFSKLKDFITVR